MNRKMGRDARAAAARAPQPLGTRRARAPGARATGQRMADLNVLPAEKRGTLVAAILMASPVRGLRPMRALRLDTAKVPNPTRETRWPFLSAPVTPVTKALSAFPADVLVIPAEFAILSINSALVMRPSWSE